MTTPKRHRWSPADDKRLTELWTSDADVRDIAAEFGTTPENIRVRTTRLRVKRPGEAPAHGPRVERREHRAIKGGLAKRFAEILGIRVTADTNEAPVPDAWLAEWLSDPEAFFKWLGVELFKYQKEGLSLIETKDRVCLVWGRQCGKDTTLSLYGLWLAVTTPKSTIVCISPAQRQSDLWMQTLQSFALMKKEIRDSIVDMSKSELTLSNGSKVYSLPGAGSSGSATVRGFSRVSLLLVNEAAWVPEETFQAVQPFLAVTGKNAKLVLCSTPFGTSGYLWRAWNSDVFAKCHAVTADNPLVPRDFLEKEKQTMDRLSYSAEYEAMFLSSQNAYFPTELIKECVESYQLTEAPLPGGPLYEYFLGCDWARIAGADKTVLTVVGIDRQTQKGKVLWIKTFDGIDYVTQANYVGWLHGIWGFEKIYSDASNYATNDLLISRSLPVEAIKFAVMSKVELFGRLRASMEAKRITLPNHPDLIRELSTFEYRISEVGNLLLHHVENGHDDFPDSLALASYELTAESTLLRPKDALETARGIAALSAAYDNLIRSDRSGTHPDIYCGKCQKWFGEKDVHQHDS